MLKQGSDYWFGLSDFSFVSVLKEFEMERAFEKKVEAWKNLSDSVQIYEDVFDVPR